MPSEVGGRFDGQQFALKSQSQVWVVVRLDSNIAGEFKLFHRDANAAHWNELASGRGSMSIRIDQAASTLRFDSLRWLILCAPLKSGTFPVFVQLFQGSQLDGFTELTRIARYDVTVGAGHELELVNDFLTIS